VKNTPHINWGKGATLVLGTVKLTPPPNEWSSNWVGPDRISYPYGSTVYGRTIEDAGLDRIGSDWIGLDWIGLDWIPAATLCSTCVALANPTHYTPIRAQPPTGLLWSAGSSSSWNCWNARECSMSRVGQNGSWLGSARSVARRCLQI